MDQFTEDPRTTDLEAERLLAAKFLLYFPTEESARLVEQLANLNADTTTCVSSRFDWPHGMLPYSPIEPDRRLPWLLEVRRPMEDADAIDEAIEAWTFIVEHCCGGRNGGCEFAEVPSCD